MVLHVPYWVRHAIGYLIHAPYGLQMQFLANAVSSNEPNPVDDRQLYIKRC